MSLTTKKFDGLQFNEFDYIEDSVTVDTGLFRVQTVPTAKIETDATVDFTANQRVRILDPNGSVFFEGRTASAGSYAPNGRKTITVEHDAKRFVEDKVSYDRVDQSPEAHLNQIETEAAESFTISYNSSATATIEYGPDEKRVRRAIQDILDEADVVAYFEMDSDTLVVADRNTGPQYRDVSTESDPILIQNWEEGTVDSVRNAVTVIPAGGLGLPIAATAQDSASISEYGRRAQTYNIESIYTFAVAQAFANSLLQPKPLASGKIQVAGGTDFYTELANQSIEVTDSTRDLSNRSLLISKQTIRPNRVLLGIGDAPAKTATQVNRGVQTSLETNKAGTVIDTNRIADDAIASAKLVDTSVTEQKLEDLSVATDKLQDNAIINGKLDDLSVSETKIQDDSIATPKLKAEAVTASEIDANTITANEIDSGTITALEILSDTLTADEIDSGTITAKEIESDTLTANEIDTLDLSANVLTISDTPSNPDSGIEFTVDSNGRLGMSPFGTTVADIGLNNRFRQIRGRDGRFSAGLLVGSPPLILPTGGEAIFNPDNGNTEIEIREASGTTVIAPNDDKTGEVGTAADAFNEMNAGSFITQSAPTFAGDAKANLQHADYGAKDLPKWVLADAPDKDDLATDRSADEDRISLGRMCSWLLSVCQSQDERIDELEDRISGLEKHLSDSGGN